MIFVDTSFWVAMVLPRDENHQRAQDALSELDERPLSTQLLTTNNVILESITVARYNANHRVAVEMSELLYEGGVATIYRPTANDESKAVAYLRKHEDKVYSAVDCLSFVVMLDRGITEALAFDDDFSHRFVMRPGKPRK